MITGLALDADLEIEVDAGAAGHAVGRLTGTGRRLHLQVDHPEILAAATGRSVVAVVAAELARAGISAELHGPRGRIAHLDPRRTSRLGALVTGSPHVGIDAAAWSVAGDLARRALPPGRVVAALAGVAVAAFVLGRRTR